MSIVSREDYFEAKVSNRSRLEIMDKIKDRLSPENNLRFMKSCFGRFAQFQSIKNTQFQGSLYLHLLFMQDKSLAGDSLVFHVNNTEAEFGLNEFALVTGLHFGPKSPIPNGSNLYKRLFKNKSKVFVKDIEEAFLSETDSKKTKKRKDKKTDHEDLILKLALMWVLYGILLMRGRTDKTIDVDYTHLAENVDDFNKYPWGRVAYDFLVKEFRRSIKGRVRKWAEKVAQGEIEHKEHIDVHGFGYAILIWAYEAMPSVAMLCASSPKTKCELIPRMLRWDVSSKSNFDDLTRHCFPILKPGDQISKRLIVLKNLTPSNEEMMQPFFSSLKIWREQLGESKLPTTTNLLKRRRIDDGNENAEVRRKRDKQSVAPHISILNRIRNLERMMTRILSNQKCIMEKLKCVSPVEDEDWHNNDDDKTEDEDWHDDDDKTDEDSDSYVDGEDPVVVKDQKKHGKQHSESKGESSCQGPTSNDKDGKVVKAGTSHVDSIEQDQGPLVQENSNDKDGKVVKAGTSHVDSIEQDQDPLVQENSNDEDGKVVKAGTSHVDSIEQDQSPDDSTLMAFFEQKKADLLHGHLTGAINDFSSWYRNFFKTTVTIPITVDNVVAYGARWFRCIWEKDVWLGDDQIDVLLKLLVYKAKKWPGRFHQKWTHVDMFFWSSIVDNLYPKWSKAAAEIRHLWKGYESEKWLSKYIEGRYPVGGHGLPWAEASFIYGVAHVSGNHWVLYELRMEHHTIVVYDSLSGRCARPNSKHIGPLKKLAKLLPSMCAYFKVQSQSKGSTQKNEWDILPYRDAPQQKNDYDCGIMCIRMLEALTTGNLINLIDESKCRKFRRRYCAELFNCNYVLPPN